MKETGDLRSRLNNVSNEKGLDAFIKDVEDNHKLTLKDYMYQLMIERDISKADVSRLSKLDRSYTSQIIENNPSKKPGRDKMLCIALGLNLSVEETDKLLTLSGNNPLYPRVKRDSIIAYALNKNMNVMDTNAELSKHGEKELK